MPQATDPDFKAKCKDLEMAIKTYCSTGSFRVITLHGTRYIYNAISRNIIWRARLVGGGVQEVSWVVFYRPTSHYADVMKSVNRVSGAPVSKIVASPNMVRHVRDVRQALGVA